MIFHASESLLFKWYFILLQNFEQNFYYGSSAIAEGKLSKMIMQVSVFQMENETTLLTTKTALKI